MRVFVTVYEHRHGTDVYAFATAQRAELERQRIASEWWSDVFGDGEEMPDDPSEAADIYFDTVTDEYFNVEECEVQA